MERKRGRRLGEMHLGRADLALAYELRQEGLKNILIAAALGCNANYLYTLLARCEREGLGWVANP